MDNIPSMLTRTETINKIDSQTDEILPAKCPPLAVLLLRVRCLQEKIASELLVPFSVPEEIKGSEEFICSRIIFCLREGKAKNLSHELTEVDPKQPYFLKLYIKSGSNNPNRVTE